MATKTDKSTTDQGDRAELAPQPFWNYWEHWCHGASEVTEEMSHFMSARLEKDASFSRDMAGCTSATDAARLQQAWLIDTARDYFSEAPRLGRMMLGASRIGNAQAPLDNPAIRQFDQMLTALSEGAPAK